MKFDILPLKGFAKIRFGMSPEQIRQNVSGSLISFKKGPLDIVPSDYSEKDGIFFYYDSDRKLQAIEFATPAQPMIHGVNPLELTFEAAKKALSALDDHIENEVDSATALGLGVSIWSPLAKDDPDAPVESVLIFGSGYYHKHLASSL